MKSIPLTLPMAVCLTTCLGTVGAAAAAADVGPRTALSVVPSAAATTQPRTREATVLEHIVTPGKPLTRSVAASSASVASVWTPQRIAEAVRNGDPTTARALPLRGQVGGKPRALVSKPPESTQPNTAHGQMASSDPDDARIPNTPAPYMSAGFRTVGVMVFLKAVSGTGKVPHGCTASVVTSPVGNVVATAAHCAAGLNSASQAAFVPWYANGIKPGMGVFPIESVTYEESFTSHGTTPHLANLDDIAFMKTGRGTGTNTTKYYPQVVVGSAEITPILTKLPTNTTLTTRLGTARAWGYPGAAHVPRMCTAPMYAVKKPIAGSLYWFYAMGCDPFPGGVSGGPFYANVYGSVWGPTNRLQLVGLVGGWAEGGTANAVSYSVIFGPRVMALFNAAASKV